MNLRHGLLAGAVVCTSTLGTRAQTPVKVLALRPEFRLSAETHTLSALGGVSVGPGGILAVSQGQDRQVRLFSATGVSVATLGRRGSGPGEFQAVGTTFWGGDTLWVVDSRLNRLSAFSQQGKYLRGIPLPASLGAAFTATDGRRFSQPSFVSRDDHGAMHFKAVRRDEASGKWSTALISLGVDGQLTRVGAELPADDCAREEGNSQMMLPFCPRLWIGSSPAAKLLVTVETAMDGARPARVRLTARQASGTVAYTKEIAVPVERLTAADVASYRDPDPRIPPHITAFYRRTPMPDARPPFQGIQVGPDGSTWLLAGRLIEGHYEWHGFDAKGARLGIVRIREESALMSATTTAVWVNERDADGLETLVRYRIVR